MPPAPPGRNKCVLLRFPGRYGMPCYEAHGKSNRRDGRMDHPAVILWDWDNTLIDGWAAVTAALNATFAAFARQAWTIEQTRARARGRGRDSFPDYFGPDWERAAALFRATMRARHLDHLTPMPGAAEALEAGSAWPQGVVSNKDGAFLRREVQRLGWAHRFGAVVGA